MESKKKLFIVYPVLAVLLVVGAVLRFYGLDKESLWNDELATWRMSRYATLSEVINKGARPDVHPPGYYILIHYIETYIGDSEKALRFPSAVAGIVSIGMMFLLGLCFYSWTEALISAGLMTVAWCPIYYSQEARSNSLLLLLSMVSMGLWYRIVCKIDNRLTFKSDARLVFSYIGCSVVLSYVHYFGLFFVFLQGVVLLIYSLRKNVFLSAMGIYFILLCLYLPWIPTFFNHLGHTPAWISPPDWKSFLNFIKFCFNFSNVIFLPLIPLLGLYMIKKRKQILNFKLWNLQNPDFLIVLWITVPFLIVYIQSFFSSPVLLYRNLLISLPAIYLITARSITSLDLKPISQVAVAVLLVSFIAGHNIFINRYYDVPQKQQLEKGIRYIAAYDRKINGDSDIIGYAWSLDYFQYYLDKTGFSRVITANLGEMQDEDRIEPFIHSGSRYLWYIAFHRRPDPEFIDYMKNAFREIDSRRFRGVRIWLFDKHVQQI